MCPTSSAFASISIKSVRRGPVFSLPNHKIISATSNAARARSIPINSIQSFVSSRTPALSMNKNGMPAIATGTSIRSRVVPAISETSAASRATNALSKVDLPQLGGPPSTTRRPLRNFSAAGAARIDLIMRESCKQPSVIFDLFNDPTSSSSEKSSSASINADKSSRSLRQPSTALLNAPPIIALAARRCHSVSAVSKSANPSASFRSIRPLAKARRVNSPASARRRFGSAARAFSTARTTARPPCRCSSAKSSPVAVFGPVKISNNA